jgi:glycosyltransferase involved in cell wall biosynthesis
LYIPSPEVRLLISVIIPAFNEERYLAETLRHLRRAIEDAGDASVEVIVVDNASTDRTREVAEGGGAKVVFVPEHNIGRVRNAGAAVALGEVLMFLDADTLVPAEVLRRVAEVVSDSGCIGGAVDTEYRPARRLVRIYLRLWRIIGLVFGMAQGAAQYCRREAFFAVGGYDERIYMGEDVDFYWRLKKLAKANGQHVRFLKEMRVVPSCRRFDQWPMRRILVDTNPLYIALLRRRPWAWDGWYRKVPR